jgi:hypothetical protein
MQPSSPNILGSFHWMKAGGLPHKKGVVRDDWVGAYPVDSLAFVEISECGSTREDVFGSLHSAL